MTAISALSQDTRSTDRPATSPSLLPLLDRNNGFTLLRHVLAFAVIAGHSFEMAGWPEPLQPLRVRMGVSLGRLAVDGFFVLSGYLIAASYLANPDARSFLAKRFRRIAPGCWVAAAISLLIVGPLSGATNYFARQNWPRLAADAVTLGPMLGVRGAFPNNAFHDVDGPIWSIRYEVGCYFLVLALGTVGLLGRARVVAVVAAFASLAAGLLAVRGIPADLGVGTFEGITRPIPRLVAWFLVGATCRSWTGWRSWPLGVFVGLALAMAACCYSRVALQVVGPWAGGLALIGLGSRPSQVSSWLEGRKLDLSYGMYLYAWPVQQFALAYVSPNPWVVLAIGTAGALAMGWLSWVGVERLALRRSPALYSAAPRPARLSG